MSKNNIYTPIVHCRILSLASILDLRSSDDIYVVLTWNYRTLLSDTV